MEGLEKPLVIYDGDCRFCLSWVARWKAETGDRAAYASYQRLAEKYPEFRAEKFRRAVHLILPDGETSSGAKASFGLFAATGVRRWPLVLYENLPGFAAVSEWGYRVIKRRRPLFLKATELLWGTDPAPSSYRRVRSLFLRALGAVYVVAFLSILPQIPGLYGDQGILPVVDTIASARSAYGLGGPWLLPSAAWLFPSGGFLQLIAIVGAACGAALAFGIIGAPVAIVAWIGYLSIVSVGGDFTSFQWDGLLLEAGFLAIFLARPRNADPPKILVWLFRFLLFRLMFGSGAVKLLSGDPSWRNLTALTVHYQTQPLPNPVSWYAHHLPLAVHKASAVGMFGVELLLPFLIFAPRRLRVLAAAGFAGLQTLIMLTGNYAFFNWLTLALCLFLLDDALLARILRRPPLSPDLSHKASAAGEALAKGEPDRALRVFAPIVAVLAAFQIGSLAFAPLRGFPVVAQISALVSPFRIVNGYGLFAVMTTHRSEIVIEASDDGETWREYAFKEKPGDVKRAPPWIAPFQPRLDWQMWFAALREPERSPWLGALLRRLLQGSDPVERLFAETPFDHAPKMVRAILYDYRFAAPRERALDGAWWKRERLTEFVPPTSLR